MPVSSGLILDGKRSFAEVCAPLADDLADCFWALDSDWQIDHGWYYESDENEDLVRSLRWNLPALAGRFAGFRSGIVPLLADRILVDEWSFFFAIKGPENRAAAQATRLAGYAGAYSETFLRDIECYADLLLCHIDGWWEFYSGRADWLERLLSAWPGCVERDVSRATESPRRGRPT
jgi:hypothetical protein